MSAPLRPSDPLCSRLCSALLRLCSVPLLRPLLSAKCSVGSAPPLRRLTPVCAVRDPHILNIYLFNALLYCGDCMLEVVSPTDEGWEEAPGGLGGRGPNTQAKQLDKQGDSGYMAIFQVEDQEGVSKRLMELGVRPVGTPTMMFNKPLGEGGASHMTPESAVSSSYVAGDPVPPCPTDGSSFNCGVQWHPADAGTLLETDQVEPNLPGAAGCWGPAGNGWQHGLQRKSTVCEEFAGVTIAVADPPAMAAKYATAFDKPLVLGGTAVQIDTRADMGGVSLVKFVPLDSTRDGRAGVVGLDIFAAPEGAGAGSRTAGRKAFNSTELCGVRFTLVDRATYGQDSDGPAKL